VSTPPAQPGPSGLDGGSLTHLDEHGRARMVDVTAKPLTRRVALARCAVVTAADATKVLGEGQDGLDPVEGARFAGIQAAKQTSSLIPLCHPIRIHRVTVDVDVDVHKIEISAVTEIVERTGVEMEALTACAVAALSLVKALIHVDPDASIEDLTLWHKSGGRSGDWERNGPGGRLIRRLAPAKAMAGGSDTSGQVGGMGEADGQDG
jgi:cyclic pyranopterin phosphate synthase